MDCIINKKDPSSVPNLSWRDENGEVHQNPLSHVPDELSDVMLHYYDHTVSLVVKHRDLSSYLPFKDWLRYPITAVLTCRGCTENCLVCGGSAAAFRHAYNRGYPAFRSPEAVARDVKSIGRITNGPIFILGDIRQAGEDYAYRLLELLARERAKNQLILELFNPAPREFLKKWVRHALGSASKSRQSPMTLRYEQLAARAIPMMNWRKPSPGPWPRAASEWTFSS